jgi:hypothetical protein
MSGKSAVRQADDIGTQELDYATVKSIASGNPAVLTLAEADAEIQRLSILRKNHHDEQFIIRRRLRDLPDDINCTALWWTLRRSAMFVSWRGLRPRSSLGPAALARHPRHAVSTLMVVDSR